MHRAVWLLQAKELCEFTFQVLRLMSVEEGWGLGGLFRSLQRRAPLVHYRRLACMIMIWGGRRAAVVVVCTQGAESSLIGLISPILSEARQKRGKREGALILLLPPPIGNFLGLLCSTLTKEQIGGMAGQGFPRHHNHSDLIGQA